MWKERNDWKCWSMLRHRQTENQNGNAKWSAAKSYDFGRETFQKKIEQTKFKELINTIINSCIYDVRKV